MKDLKHLIYFERLLEEANNELVKQAKTDHRFGAKSSGFRAEDLRKQAVAIGGSPIFEA